MHVCENTILRKRIFAKISKKEIESFENFGSKISKKFESFEIFGSKISKKTKVSHIWVRNFVCEICT